jgi:hypothetical protein
MAIPQFDHHFFQVRNNSIMSCPLSSEVLEPLGWSLADLRDLVAQVREVEGCVGYGVKFGEVAFVDDPAKESPSFYIPRSGPGVFADHEIVFNLSNSLGINPRKYGPRYRAFSRYMIAHAMGHHMLLLHPDCVQGVAPPIPEGSPESWRPMVLAQCEEIKVEKIAEDILGPANVKEGVVLWMETVVRHWTDVFGEPKGSGIRQSTISCVCGL